MKPFDRTFFEQMLPVLWAEFTTHRGLSADEAIMLVRLRDGSEFPITGGRWTDDWIVLFTEDDTIRVVAITDVFEFMIERRPPNVSKPPVGFARFEPMRTGGTQ